MILVSGKALSRLFKILTKIAKKERLRKYNKFNNQIWKTYRSLIMKIIASSHILKT